MVRCMVKQIGMPKSFQSEVVNTITYVLNNCQTRRLKNKVSEGIEVEKSLVCNISEYYYTMSQICIGCQHNKFE